LDVKLIGLVHTTRLVVDPLHEVMRRSLPDAEVSHVLDEGILKRLAQVQEITPEIVDWLTSMVRSTETVGADCTIVSCSSLSPCVNEVRKRITIPVLKVDEPMVEFAVSQADRIGLLMTNPTTEKSSTLLFGEVSERLGRSPLLVSRLCSDAFEKLTRGDISGHDSMVVSAVEQLLEEVDLVMLAQISIARIKDKLDHKVAAKVLSSLDFIGPRAGEILNGDTIETKIAEP
jgi:Asp/Glu/hydantoin racemase